MAKRFKLRFSRVIPSFQFCRSKHPSTFPGNPIPSIYRLSPINPKATDITYPTNFPNPPPSTPQHHPTPVHPSSIKRHVSFKSVTVSCGCRSRSCARYLSSGCSTESPDYTWTRNGKWHVVGKVEEEEDDSKPRRKIYSPSDSGDTDDDVSVTPLLNSTTKQIKKQRSKKKKNVRTCVRTSTSSGDSGWFTSEENDEETETLVSSRSFSNYSSNDVDDQFDSKSKKQSNNPQTKSNAKNVPKKLKRHASKNWKGSSDSATGKPMTKNKTPSPEFESPVRTSVLRRMMPCKVEGKVMESFAVVKKSEDPYEDFRRSMLEMILEKQMFDAKDLEELLHCFLSLNSRHHHGVIVEAFSEIWEVLFSSKSPVNQQRANLFNR